MIRLDPPESVLRIARRLENAGFETWAVGGAVRDSLLGIPSADWDLTTRARPEEMRRLFRRTVPIGIDHGTVGILEGSNVMYEVTTFRRDVETSGRHAVVEFADTLEEDLARRDFTINAVAWHPLQKRLFDPFGGAADLERLRLRTVGSPTDRFAEDYLRVLRALRFAGRYALEVETETWTALCRAVPGMGRLSPERVREELEKVLADGSPPSRALSLYAASGAQRFLYPELDVLVGRDGLWSASLRAVDLIPAHRWELRLAALLHGVGEPDPGAWAEDPASEDLSMVERAEVRAAALLTRLRFSNARIGRVGAWVGAVAGPPPPGASPAEMRGWLARIGRNEAPGALMLLGFICRGRRMSGPGSTEVDDPEASSPTEVASMLRQLRRELASGAPLSEAELALDGRDLIRMGYRPGPEFGVVLRRLLDRVLEDPGRNRVDTLTREARGLLEESGDPDD